jgi:hypothetical protein
MIVVQKIAESRQRIRNQRSVVVKKRLQALNGCKKVAFILRVLEALSLSFQPVGEVHFGDPSFFDLTCFRYGVIDARLDALNVVGGPSRNPDDWELHISEYSLEKVIA